MRRGTDARGRAWSGFKISGQAMVEYLIIVPILLMLTLGAIQFAMLYHIKSTLNYATFMAARQGSLKNAKPNAIKDGLAAGMTPLFTVFAVPPDTSPSPALALVRGRVIAMIEVFNPLTTTVEILSPVPEAYEDFDPDKANKTIPNDNLMYRCTGSPCTAPTGAKSGITIQDANILKIRVTYCAKLIVPFANATLYALVNGIEGTKNLTAELYSSAPKTAKTPNKCSKLKDQFGGKVDKLTDGLTEVSKAAGIAGVSIDTSVISNAINSALSAASSALDGATIPFLNWGIGGYRIPITSEAVIRMQSPAIKP